MGREALRDALAGPSISIVMGIPIFHVALSSLVLLIAPLFTNPIRVSLPSPPMTWFHYFLELGFDAFLTLLLGPISEEAGWRGYALGALSNLAGVLPATFTIGIVWACWHWPLFRLPGTLQHDALHWWPFFVSVVASSFLYTWIWAHTGGNLWAAVLFHFWGNWVDGRWLPCWKYGAPGEWIRAYILSLCALLAAVMVYARVY